MVAKAKTALTIEQRITRMIDEALELASLGDRYVPSTQIAERLYETEPKLIEEASKGWILDRLTWLISRRRRLAREAGYPGKQMLLDDPVFRNLPRTIFLRNGSRPRLAGCTVSQTEDHLKLLRDRYKNHPRVARFERLVEIHKKWAAVQKGITWEEAERREAEERGLMGE